MSCPFASGEQKPTRWDYTRPCIKCQKPGHEPWKCPTKNIVKIINREFPPHILVDYKRSDRPSARVSYVDHGHCATATLAPMLTGMSMTPMVRTMMSGMTGRVPMHQMGTMSMSMLADDDDSLNVSALRESDRSVDDDEVGHSANTDDIGSGGMQIAEVADEARVNAVGISGGNSSEVPRVSVREAIERGFLGSMTLRTSVIYYVNLIPSRSELKGAVLVDSGAQIGLDNDITVFIGYLEKSDVKIGMVESSATLKNGGVGTRERRFKSTDGNVYVKRDRAYYCPDAMYPIYSTGEWEEQDATIIFNPSQRFLATSKGTVLPSGGKHALIIDRGRACAGNAPGRRCKGATLVSTHSSHICC